MDEERMQRAGLLDGLSGDQRRGRVALVRDLLDQGASLDEVVEAARDHRLFLLPVERALETGDERFTTREAAGRTGLTIDQLDQLRRTLGLPALDPDAATLTSADLDAFAQAAMAVEAGLAFDGVLEVNAVLASGMPALAATMRHLAATVLVSSDDERRTALELASAARDLVPVVVPVLEYALRAHLADQVVRDFAELGLDREAEQSHCVGFADLVGFTRLSERTQPHAVGTLNDQLAQTARRVLAGRSRLVKTIGDAVMVTAPTPQEVASTLLDLLAAASDMSGGDDDRLQLHAGMAFGPVLHRAGDVFGRVVNRASRLTDHAEAGRLVCDEASGELMRSEDGLILDPLPAVRLKGIEDPQQVYTVAHQTRPG